VAKGAALPHDLQGDPGDVTVVVTLGALTQCLEFGGQKNFKFGKKFLAKNAAAPGTCPVPGGGSTTTTTVGTSTTTTTLPPSGLAALIGSWRFQFTIISTFTEDYSLTHIESVEGVPTLVGTDELGGLVIVSRTADLGGGVPFEFAMLDPGTFLCDFYLFDQPGPNSISGEHYTMDVDALGSCDQLFGPDPLSGTRLSSVAVGSAEGPREEHVRPFQRLRAVADGGASALSRRMMETLAN
jgi:hypothetical protein